MSELVTAVHKREIIFWINHLPQTIKVAERNASLGVLERVESNAFQWVLTDKGLALDKQVLYSIYLELTQDQWA